MTGAAKPNRCFAGREEGVGCVHLNGLRSNSGWEREAQVRSGGLFPHAADSHARPPRPPLGARGETPSFPVLAARDPLHPRRRPHLEVQEDAEEERPREVPPAPERSEAEEVEAQDEAVVLEVDVVDDEEPGGEEAQGHGGGAAAEGWGVRGSRRRGCVRLRAWHMGRRGRAHRGSGFPAVYARAPATRTRSAAITVQRWKTT